MAIPNGMYPLIDRLLNGQFRQKLADWRADGLSFSDIAFKLRLEHNINVTDETVRRWARELEIPEPDRATS